ncbi:glycoside hydrolase family 2 protein [Halococcoides cellulosivorans]|nr:hydrolase [Halococcoides cellulosivorans]
MDLEWSAGVVDRGGDPSPDEWTPVTVPGRPAQFADADAVAYRCSFGDPRDDPAEHVLVELDGAFAETSVWLNGEHIVDHDVYFEPLRIALHDELDPENELVVRCARPSDAFGGNYSSSRTPPSAAVPAIRWGATVERRPATFVDRVGVVPHVVGDHAELTVTAAIVSSADRSDRVTVSVRPETASGRATMERAAVDLSETRRSVVSHEVRIDDPIRWWPWELGDPHRYRVGVSIADSEASVHTGIATVGRDDGRLVVNDRTVRGRGLVLDDATPEAVSTARDLGATVVRPRAHVPPRSVQTACDERGMLCWQDLPLTGPVDPDVDRGRTIARRLFKARRRHPSLAIATVHDEPTDLTPDGPLSGGLLGRLRTRWRVWRADFDAETATAIERAFPDAIASAPVVGALGTDPDATAAFPGWSIGDADAIDWLLDRYPEAFETVGAVGVGSISDPGASFPDPVDDAHHAAHAGDDVAASQAYQRRTLKHVVERLRREGCPLFAVASLTDVDGAGMGVYDGEGEPKPARDALANAFQPVVPVLADPSPGESDVIVLNDADQPWSGDLRWTAGSASGSADVTVGTHGRSVPATIEVPEDCSRVELVLALPDGTITNDYRVA